MDALQVILIIVSFVVLILFHVAMAELILWTGRRAMIRALTASVCPYCQETLGYAPAVLAVQTSEKLQAERGFVSENGFRVKCHSCRREFLFRDGDRSVARLDASTGGGTSQ